MDEETTFDVPASQRQLFLDDHGIGTVEDLNATEGTLTVEALDDAGSVVAMSVELTGDLPQDEVM